MGCALLVYLIPMSLGFAWNSLGERYNILDPPEGYTSRLPDARIAVEPWGSAVVVVPNHVKNRIYLQSGEAPLWNPFQGLGQPFAAMGEGNPYFPPAILRSLAPYEVSNWFSIVYVFCSQVFMFMFLRNLGLSPVSSAFGGIAFALSGAVSFHLARPNILDQICMIPVLFWAISYATNAGSVRRHVLLAFVTAAHAMGGFIQVAMLSQVLAILFGFTTIVSTRHEVKLRILRLITSSIIGLGLSAFYLLPLLEWLVIGMGKDYPFLSFFTSPTANIVAFFFPLSLGPWFSSRWKPPGMGTLVAPDWVVDWNNLFAVAGTIILLLSIAGLASRKWRTQCLRVQYLFFFLAGVVLVMRYLNLPPASMLNILPVIGRQSPKHANAIMAFVFVVSAAISVDHIKYIDLRKALLYMLGAVFYFVSILVTLLGAYLFWSYQTNTLIEAGPFTKDLPYYGIAIGVVAVALLLFTKAAWISVKRPAQAGYLLCLAVASELMLYVPLGNSANWFILARGAISATLLLMGIAAVALTRERQVAAMPLGVAALVSYGLIVALPSIGLPRAFEATRLPNFMRYLEHAANNDFRSFGIFPDHSVTARLQDIGVVGPLAPYEFYQFVRMVSSQRTYDAYTGHFLLAGPWHYDLDVYERRRPILDWAGVKFFVVDRQRIPVDQIELLAALENIEVAYKDSRVTILASRSARPKAEFYDSAIVKADQNEILALLTADPTVILGAPMIESAQNTYLHNAANPQAASQVARVVEYTLNRVKVDIPEHGNTGILVLKDVFAPGWRAWVDGRAARVVRVNGVFRGVEVTQPNARFVIFEYRPASFLKGIILSVLAFALCVVFIVYPGASERGSMAGKKPLQRALTYRAGVAATFAVIVCTEIVLTYFQAPSLLNNLASWLSQEIPPFRVRWH